MGQQCGICLDECVDENHLFTCKHVFHRDCIYKWKGSCPMCRSTRNDQYAHINMLNVKDYLHIPEISKCYEKMHYLTAYQCDTPQLGCVLFCRDCRFKIYINSSG